MTNYQKSTSLSVSPLFNLYFLMTAHNKSSPPNAPYKATVKVSCENPVIVENINSHIEYKISTVNEKIMYLSSPDSFLYLTVFFCFNFSIPLDGFFFRNFGKFIDIFISPLTLTIST